MHPRHFKMITKESGAVLLLSLLVTVFLSVLLGAAMLRSEVSVKEMMQRRQMQEAFYAAETGLETAIFNLRQNPTWQPGKGGIPEITDAAFDIVIAGVPQTIGFYSITVKDAPDHEGWETKWIETTGKDSDKIITRKIKAQVIVESPAKFLISTMEDLHIQSGSHLNDLTLAKNVFFDVNKSLPTPDNEIYVNNKILYMGTVTGETNPAVIYGDDGKVDTATAITFAGVDQSRYTTLARNLQERNEGKYSAEDLNVDLNNLDTLNPKPGEKFSPQIIYSEKDIHISGKFDNSILIVAAGNLYIDGNIEAKEVTPAPQIGLFAKGNVFIPSSAANDLKIEAFVLTEGQFTAQGPKYSKGELTFKGSISAKGVSGSTAVDLNVYKKRNYTFNPDLSLTRTIPFTPFIVNTIYWQEI